MKKFFEFLDRNQWACWLGIAVGCAGLFAVEAAPAFPYNLLAG